MADVEVVFGAKIDQLTNAVAQVKNELGGLNSSAVNLMGTFGKLGSVAALATSALASFGLEEFARKMADSGVAMERMKATLGVGSEQMLTLKSAAELSGVEVEALAMTMQRMALIVQRSSRDALGPQSQALKALGLSAKDFIGLSADQYFLKIADAASQFKPSMERTTALMMIGGRSMASMAATFTKGSEEIKKFTEEMKTTKTGTEGFSGAAEITHRNLTLMDSATSSLSKQLFTQLAPTLNTIIKNSTDFANSIRESIKEGGAWGVVLDVVNISLKGIVTGMAGVGAAFKFLSAEAKAFKDAFSGEDSEKIGATLRKELDGVADDFRKIMADVWNPPKAPLHVDVFGGLKDMPEVNMLARKRLEMMMKMIDSEIAIVEEGFNRQQALYERDVLNLGLTESQKIKLVSTASGQRYAAEISLLQQKLSLGDIDIAQRQDIENKIKELVEKRITDTLKRENDYVKEVQSQWSTVLETVQGAWDSQLRGLLTRTTTWAQAMKNIVLDLVLKIISEFEKLAIVKPMIAALSDAFAPAELFASITKMIAKTIGQVFSGATAFFAPTLGPAAPAAGAAVAAATEAAAASYDVGSWNVPNTALAMVHQGEMIIPSGPAASMREGGGLGSHTVNISISAMDAGSFHSALRGGMGDAITRHVSRALQSNPSMRPGYTT